MTWRSTAAILVTLVAGCAAPSEVSVELTEFDYCYKASIQESGKVDWAIRGCPVEIFNETLMHETWIGIELPDRLTGLFVEARVLPFPGVAKLDLQAGDWNASLSWAGHVPMENPEAVFHAPAVGPTLHSALASICDQEDLIMYLDVIGVFPTVDLRVTAYVDTVPPEWPDEVEQSTCNGYWSERPILQ